MKIVLLAFVAVLLLGIEPLHAGERGDVVVSYSEPLEFLSLKPETGRAGTASSSNLVFDAFGQRFELELESNDRLLSKAFPERLGSDVGVYRGHLAGKPGSWARIVIANGIPTGLIWDGKEMLAIEALSREPGRAASTSIYRLRDTYVEPGTFSCGVPGEVPKPTSLSSAYAAVTGEIQTVIAQAAGAVEELKIGVVGDYEFTSFKGANNVDAEILTRMNNVDGIFSSQLGVQITVEVIDTFTDINDPFTTSVPTDLLNELASYRLNTPTQASQGLTFMFTGRNLDGSTAGIAYRDALCSARFGVGLSEGVRNTVTDSLIAAHEIGHNFGAEHDGETGSVCASVSGDFLMSPSVNGSDQFSNCSIDTIRPRIDAASCINPLAQTDVAIALNGAPPNLLLGASTDLVFDVSNAGTGNATNVAATFVIPTNITIDSVAATMGSCASGAGQVDCTIGTLAGNGSASVALSITADSVGTDTLDASVTADGDVDLSDNSQSVGVTVNPATDLRIVNATSRSVALDGNVTVSPRIENISTLAATDLIFMVSFSAGLRADSGTWPNGTCTIEASLVTCRLPSLPAGSSASVDLQFTGTASGSQSYTAGVSSAEAEANDSDNSASGTISVSGGTSQSDSGGGGGAFDLLWLLLLAASFGVATRLRHA